MFPEQARTPGRALRIRARCAVVVAGWLSRRSPRTVRRVLSLAARRARPAAPEHTRLCRDVVLTVSPLCRQSDRCLVRATATALLCRAGGSWPAWCVGVLSAPPFAAHAWVEAEGVPVGEIVRRSDVRVLFTVGTAVRATTDGDPARTGTAPEQL